MNEKQREWWGYTNSLGNQFVFLEKQNIANLFGEVCLIEKSEYDQLAEELRQAKAFLDKVVATLNDLLNEISEPSWADERMKYEERQITKGAIEQAKEALAEIKAMKEEK